MKRPIALGAACAAAATLLAVATAAAGPDACEAKCELLSKAKPALLQPCKVKCQARARTPSPAGAKLALPAGVARAAEGASGAAPAGLSGLRAALGNWRRGASAKLLPGNMKKLMFSFRRTMATDALSLAMARQLAKGAVDSALKDTPVELLARALYVLEVEAPGEAGAVRARMALRQVTRFGGAVSSGSEVLEQVRFFHQLYDLPCEKPLRREGTSWPPRYRCEDGKVVTTRDPTPLIHMERAPTPLVNPPSDPEEGKDEKKGDPKIAAERRATLQARDKARVDEAEDLRAPPPSEFCFRGKCHRDYEGVAAAIYGSAAQQSAPAGATPIERAILAKKKQAGDLPSLPVFCAPPRAAGAAGKWSKDRVDCSAQWLDTLGGWKPWTKEGKAAPAPEGGSIPEYACFGSPHLVRAHMVLPEGGSAEKGGFYCRRRIFRILAKDVEKSLEDQNRNIARMCSEMRQQVWGEKYQDINGEYQKWCRKDPERVRKGICLPPGAPIPGMAGSPPLPFMLLSREELLYFFGHRELFCRADRPGLTHFLYNDPWGKTFTCGVARGLLEAGPFEEGVQVCATTPFVGREGQGGDLKSDDLKARLHCWKFNRPTCEDLSRDQTKDDTRKSNVFDAFDALREVRRTKSTEAWGLYDLKDAEKLQDWQEKIAFADTSKDEGTFGVREFCRFDGSLTRFQCGYDKKSIATWYEVRRQERPAGCDSGVCARGAFARGYLCGLFQSRELFASPELPEGKPYWMCGVDQGLRGQEILRRARAICVGGAKVKDFQSPKGDKGSLQCYLRRFRWGESEATEGLLRNFDWAEIIKKKAAEDKTPLDAWVMGGPAHLRAIHSQNGNAAMTNAYGRANDHFRHLAQKDVDALVAWAAQQGHTLGHRASMRIALMSSSIPVIEEFKRLSLRAVSGGWSFNVPLDCSGSAPNALPRSTAPRTMPLGKLRGNESAKPAPAPTAPPAAGPCHPVSFKTDDTTETEDERVKALGELLDEVRTGGRSADGKWYQELRLAATEGEQLRIEPRDLELILRVHLLARVLNAARLELLWQYALPYRKAVEASARRQPLLSRLELHERGRQSSIPERFKGNIFCISAGESKTLSGIEEYVCASSPLLVAGEVERVAHEKFRRRKFTDDDLHKVRAQVKLEWCYGGTMGKPIFGLAPSRALSQKGLSSPFLMEVPASVIPRGPAGVRKRMPLRMRAPVRRSAAETRPLERLGREPGGGAAADSLALVSQVDEQTQRKFKLMRDRAAAGAKAGTASPVPASGPMRPGLKGGVSRSGLSALKGSLFKRLAWKPPAASAHWMKCTGFQYSDESWENADPKRERKAPAPQPGKKEEAPAAGADGQSGEASSSVGGIEDPAARSKAGALMDAVGGLLGAVVNFVLPQFAEAIERVRDLAHAANDFYDKWVKQFVEIGEKQWKSLQEGVDKIKASLADVKKRTADAIDDAQKQADDAAKKAKVAVDQARKKAEAALEEFHKAEVKAASETGPAKQKLVDKATVLQKTSSEADKAHKDAERALETQIAKGKAQVATAVTKAGSDVLKATGAVTKAITDAVKVKVIANTGELINGLLEELVGAVTKRAIATVETNARNLLNRGFKLVRQTLDPIAKAAIGALASVPFAGSALAPLGHILYGLALDSLESAAFDALRGIVERMLAKLVRQALTQVLAVVKEKVTKLAYGACASMFPEICPKGGREGGELKFSALPERDRWIDRAVACQGTPVFDERIYRDAAVARRHILRTGARMRTKVAFYARDMADRYLARYGYTLDSWIAAVGTNAQPQVVAQITEGLRRETAALRARLRKR